jgi:hypothetical protein
MSIFPVDTLHPTCRYLPPSVSTVVLDGAGFFARTSSRRKVAVGNSCVFEPGFRWPPAAQDRVIVRRHAKNLNLLTHCNNETYASLINN